MHLKYMMLQKKFVLVKELKNFTESSAHCESLGGSVALPETAEENQQISQMLGKDVIFLQSVYHVCIFSAASALPCILCSVFRTEL